MLNNPQQESLPGPSDTVELDLMNEAQAGNPEAYGRIFENYRSAVYRLAYAFLHDATAAEDAVQETFLKGLDRIRTFRGESGPKAWFTSIAINVCRHRLREGKRGLEWVEDRTLDSGRRINRPRTKGAYSRAVQKENNRLLALAMGFLTESQREVFVLHYDQGLAYDEIGKILGIRAGAARALAHRAKEALRRQLDSEVWVSKHV